ncbi:RICIN domain-containing protein [Actinoplanes sp. NPDC051494]|uniref:RICIN domain-containing protein n=1 Tax=Actinoplanes sp. NPDC051494 TaxID=3363907 RepID=UPI0037AC4C0A
MRNPFTRRGDEGSMAMAMLVSLVAMSITAALVPVVVNTIGATRTVVARTSALDVAQAGIDAALAQIRSAGSLVTTDGVTSLVGSLTALPPCLMTGVANLGLDTGQQKYSVAIDYWGLPDDLTSTTAVKLSCPPVDVPTTATLSSTGTDSTGKASRTIEATYTFKTNNANIEGGAIKLSSPTVNQLCVDGGDTPAIDGPVTVQLCEDGGSAQQRFTYTKDLNIRLGNSQSGDAPAGLCLEAPTPHANKGYFVFKNCLGRVARQQWSLNNNSVFQGTTDGVNLDNFCINVETAGAPGRLWLNTCTATANKNIFRSETAVGAGMASADTRQLVNFKQFSRCLDVTNHVPTSSYMIVWFCKQQPDGQVSWNQQWDLPASATTLTDGVNKQERIRTYGSGNPGYCLRSPGNTSGYVTMSSCTVRPAVPDKNLTKNLQWIVYGDTGDYATSYRIVDAYGYCLTPTDLSLTVKDTHSDGTAKVKVAACTADDLQKWNAPANFNKPNVLTNTREK